MKNRIEPAKIWIIAVFISLASFIYLQTDEPIVEQDHVTLEEVQEVEEFVEEAEVSMLDLDLIKGLTVLIMEFLLED